MKGAIGIMNGNWRSLWKRDVEDEPTYQLDILDVLRIARDVASGMIRDTKYPQLVERGQKRMAELDEQERLLQNITLEAQDIYGEHDMNAPVNVPMTIREFIEALFELLDTSNFMRAVMDCLTSKERELIDALSAFADEQKETVQ